MYVVTRDARDAHRILKECQKLYREDYRKYGEENKKQKEAVALAEKRFDDLNSELQKWLNEAQYKARVRTISTRDIYEELLRVENGLGIPKNILTESR